MARTEALNKIAAEFFTTFRKKDGEYYELDSLRVMVTVIERYLSEKEYKRSIIRNRDFKSSSKFLKEEPDYTDNNAKTYGQTSEP